MTFTQLYSFHIATLWLFWLLVPTYIYFLFYSILFSNPKVYSSFTISLTLCQTFAIVLIWISSHICHIFFHSSNISPSLQRRPFVSNVAVRATFVEPDCSIYSFLWRAVIFILSCHSFKFLFPFVFLELFSIVLCDFYLLYRVLTLLKRLGCQKVFYC